MTVVEGVGGCSPRLMAHFVLRMYTYFSHICNKGYSHAVRRLHLNDLKVSRAVDEFENHIQVILYILNIKVNCRQK